MRYTLIALAASAALSLSSPSLAASPKWNLLEVNYQTISIDDLDGFDPKGFGINGSYLLSDDVFVTGKFSRASDDLSGVDFDFDQANVGIGYRYALNGATDVYATLSYEKVELTASANGASGNADDDGLGVAVGTRSMLMDALEVGAYVSYVNLGDAGEVGYGVDANYYLTDSFAVNVGYQSIADFDTLRLGVRFAF